MLSNENIRKINRQIESELRNSTAFMASNEDKMAALDRVAKLKSMLEPTPEPADLRKTIVQELAALIAETQKPEPTQVDTLIEALFGNRR